VTKLSSPLIYLAVIDLGDVEVMRLRHDSSDSSTERVDVYQDDPPRPRQKTAKLVKSEGVTFAQFRKQSIAPPDAEAAVVAAIEATEDGPKVEILTMEDNVEVMRIAHSQYGGFSSSDDNVEDGDHALKSDVEDEAVEDEAEAPLLKKDGLTFDDFRKKQLLASARQRQTGQTGQTAPFDQDKADRGHDGDDEAVLSDSSEMEFDRARDIIEGVFVDYLERDEKDGKVLEDRKVLKDGKVLEDGKVPLNQGRDMDIDVAGAVIEDAFVAYLQKKEEVKPKEEAKKKTLGKTKFKERLMPNNKQKEKLKETKTNDKQKEKPKLEIKRQPSTSVQEKKESKSAVALKKERPLLRQKKEMPLIHLKKEIPSIGEHRKTRSYVRPDRPKSHKRKLSKSPAKRSPNTNANKRFNSGKNSLWERTVAQQAQAKKATTPKNPVRNSNKPRAKAAARSLSKSQRVPLGKEKPVVAPKPDQNPVKPSRRKKRDQKSKPSSDGKSIQMSDNQGDHSPSHKSYRKTPVPSGSFNNNSNSNPITNSGEEKGLDSKERRGRPRKKGDSKSGANSSKKPDKAGQQEDVDMTREQAEKILEQAFLDLLSDDDDDLREYGKMLENEGEVEVDSVHPKKSDKGDDDEDSGNERDGVGEGSDEDNLKEEADEEFSENPEKPRETPKKNIMEDGEMDIMQPEEQVESAQSVGSSASVPPPDKGGFDEAVDDLVTRLRDRAVLNESDEQTTLHDTVLPMAFNSRPKLNFSNSTVAETASSVEEGETFSFAADRKQPPSSPPKTGNGAAVGGAAGSSSGSSRHNSSSGGGGSNFQSRRSRRGKAKS
jgi:hypothetical protein